MYYYGVKAHVVARKREASLADLEIIFIEEAKRQVGPQGEITKKTSLINL